MLGKTFFSPEICQINSVLFSIRFDSLNKESFFRGAGEEFIRSIDVVNYLNMGIITGRGKGKEDPLNRKSISECELEKDDLVLALPTFGQSLRHFEYTEKFISKSECLRFFLKHRPILDGFLKKKSNSFIHDMSFDSWSCLVKSTEPLKELNEFPTWCSRYQETLRKGRLDIESERRKRRINPFRDLKLDFFEQSFWNYDLLF